MPLTKGAGLRKVAAALNQDTSSQPVDCTPASVSGSRPSPSRVGGPSTPHDPGEISAAQFGSWSVRADSLTPYSDATNCRHSKVSVLCCRNLHAHPMHRRYSGTAVFGVSVRLQAATENF